MKITTEEILLAPLAQLSQWINSNQVTVEEVVQAFIDRSEAVNPVLNAYQITLFDEALAKAKSLDAQKAPKKGRLFGIPFTVKSQFDVAGIPNTGGTTGRVYVPNKPATNAPVVQRLLDEGAILMGITSMPEAGSAFVTDNLIGEAAAEATEKGAIEDPELAAIVARFKGGLVVNPFDTSKTPGGSSGGEAALIASLASPFGLGTDGLGSIRIPASWCGITGIKPTRGRVPLTQGALDAVGQVEQLGTYGPLAKYAEDLELLYEIISGDDGRDNLTGGIPAYTPSRNKLDLKGLRVGLITGESAQGEYAEQPQSEVVDALNAVAEKLATAGATVIRLEAESKSVLPINPPAGLLPGLNEQGQPVKNYAKFDLVNDPALLGLQLFGGGNGSGGMAGLLASPQYNTGVPINGVGYDHNRFSPLLLGFFEEISDNPLFLYHGVLNPVDPSAPGKPLDEAIMVNIYRDYVQNTVRGMFAGEEGLDVLLSPITSRTAIPTGNSWNERQVISFASLHSVTGMPELSVPVGQDAEGMPIGAGFAADYMQEELLFALAKWAEKEFGGYQQPNIEALMEQEAS